MYGPVFIAVLGAGFRRDVDESEAAVDAGLRLVRVQVDVDPGGVEGI